MVTGVLFPQGSGKFSVRRAVGALDSISYRPSSGHQAPWNPRPQALSWAPVIRSDEHEGGVCEPRGLAVSETLWGDGAREETVTAFKGMGEHTREGTQEQRSKHQLVGRKPSICQAGFLGEGGASVVSMVILNPRATRVSQEVNRWSH